LADTFLALAPLVFPRSKLVL